MRKTGLVLGALFLAAVTAGLLLRTWHPPSTTSQNEPQYNGRTLSDWLLHPGTIPAAQREAAVIAIGTNAIPCLLQWLRAEDGPAAIKANSLAARRPGDRSNTAFARNMMGTEGFRILGPIAKPAVPALIEILNGDDSAQVKGRAGLALWSVDPEVAQKGGWVIESPSGR